MPLNRQLYFGIALLVIQIITCRQNINCQPRQIDSLKKAIANNAKKDTNKVIQLNQIAFAYYYTNIDDLKVYGNSALKLSQQIKYKRGEAIAYKNLGLGYAATNANPIALSYFDKSLKMFDELKDKANRWRVLNNIGLYYGLIKDQEHEISYYLMAIAELKQLKDYKNQIFMFGNIGNSYESVNKLIAAREYYNQELQNALKFKLQPDIALSYTNLASIDIKERRLQSALNYCNRALEIKNHSNDFRPRTLATIYSLLGKIYFELQNYNKARQVLVQSSEINNKIGQVEGIMADYHEFYLLDSVKGDFQSALSNYYHFSRLNDSLNNMSSNRIVASYQAQFDLQRKADENQRLRVEEEKNKSIISQQKTIQTILVLGLILICSGVIYLKKVYDQVKAKNEIINQQNNILETNNLVKDKLFSVVSHDLRSPITQVIGLLNLLDSGDLTLDEMATLTPAVKNTITNTLELLDNLLIWSKNQLQGFHLIREKFSLLQLITESIRALDGVIQEKQIKVLVDISPNIVVNADKEMIQIVMRNLLSNAVKFTKRGGTVNSTGKIENNLLIICVEDTGIGIKEADLHKIFSFTSHTTLGTANEKGTGIGLKICKDFIEMNNGRIWVESKEHVGSKFCVSIPV